MDRHDEIRELLADYTLGELPAAERERVRAHVATCAECAAESRELALAFQGIGLAADPVAPPPHLKARVLAQLASERHPSTSQGREGLRTPRPVGSWWLAAAAALAVVLGGLLIVATQRAARLADDLERADNDIARLTSEAADVAGQADLVVSILTATDMRRIDLEGYDAARNATARAYWSATKGLLIVADRLPVPPPGRTYQVWLIGNESPGPVSAGIIDSETTGRGMLIVAPPGGVRGSSVTVAVTDEPIGGAPSPTGSKHLAGS